VRYAVLSDIHANGEALSAVLSSMEKAGLEHAVCLGDTVGYGAEPSEAIRSVRKWSQATVLGNHDHASVEEGADETFNEWAREAIAWTRDRLDRSDRDYLAGLPPVARYHEALLVHASPAAPTSWGYVLGTGQAAAAFAAFEETICFIGHSHEPCFFELEDGSVRMLPPGTIELRPGARYLVNAGSVGQPRDRDPRACYAAVDTEGPTVEIVRVPYDAEKTARKIEEAGLPAILGERLLQGM